MSRTRNNPMADDLMRPLYDTGVWFAAAVFALGTLVLCGLAAWGYQLWHGMGVVGAKSDCSARSPSVPRPGMSL